MTPSELVSLMESGLSRLGIRFTLSHIDLLTRYIKEIEKWNKKINLVKASGKTLIIKHLFDCLSGLSAFQNTVKKKIILDIGSGAGFPGIPLSVFMPNSLFILAERSGKKAGFLRNCILLPGFKNIKIFEDDFKHLDKKVDIITYRAFSPIEKILDDTVQLLNPGGRIIAFKGRRQKIEDEFSGINPKVFMKEIIKIEVPFLDEERHLVVMELM